MSDWPSITVNFCHYYFPHKPFTFLVHSSSYPSVAPVIKLSHCVFLQISQMADDTMVELDRYLAVKTKELLG